MSHTQKGKGMNVSQQLHFIQTLTLTLQSSADPTELQEQLLAGLVDYMHFPRAVVAVYEPGANVLTGWLSRGGERDAPIGHAALLPVDSDGGPVAQAMASQEPLRITDGRPPTANPELNQGLALGHCYHIFPMYLRGQPVGVLIVDCTGKEELEESRAIGLGLLANYAGVALGSLRLCIDRAQRQAIEEERSRIAADIHDTVSQSLFGLAYGLSACTDMLPDDPPEVARVKEKLRTLHPLAFTALHQIRSAILEILPGDLNRSRFVNGLEKHLAALCADRPIQLTVEVTPQFNRWPLDLRRQLFLIAQEAIANVGRHAAAQHAWVKLSANNGAIRLQIVDDGAGFQAEKVALLPGVGVEGMRRRVEELRGHLEIRSCPGQGTTILATVPFTPQERAGT